MLETLRRVRSRARLQGLLRAQDRLAKRVAHLEGHDRPDRRRHPREHRHARIAA
jgi:hypothetical protein